MNTQLEATSGLALQEGIVGCIVATIYLYGAPIAEDYDKMLDTLAGREIFLEVDLFKLIKNQAALRYILDEDDFLVTSCEKITDDWKRPVFTMVCDLIIDRGLSLASVSFLKALKRQLGIGEVRDILDILSVLHKDRNTELLFSV